MTVRFTVPASWRSRTKLSRLSCEAATVGAALEWFVGCYPTLRERVLNNDGGIAPSALVSLDETDVRQLDGLRTPIGPGDHEVSILAAFMGG